VGCKWRIEKENEAGGGVFFLLVVCRADVIEGRIRDLGEIVSKKAESEVDSDTRGAGLRLHTPTTHTRAGRGQGNRRCHN